MHVRVYGAQPDEMGRYDKAVETHGLTFEFTSVPLSEENVCEVGDNVDALLVMTNCQVNETVIAELAKKGVKYVACRSAGSDNVDYKAIKKYGLKACNVPAYAPEAISEHTVMVALWTIRNGNKSYEKIKAGDYTMAGLRGRQIGQMTAGVLGTGRIGRTTMQMLKGFGTNILGWDPYPNDAAAQLCTYATKEEVFAQSDILFLHCPLTDDSYHIINEETLAMMKPGAVLINTARGGLVDHAAVLKALEEGKLSGFAFDVYENEAAFVRKKKTMEEINDPVFEALLKREDTYYSAHVAFFTDAAIYSMIDVTLDNLKEYDTTGSCRNEIVEVG